MTLYMLLLISSICLITFLIYKLLNRRPHDHTLGGKFFVNGKGKVGIDLCDSHEPTAVSVAFSDDFNTHPCHPCNPHHDKLDWEVVQDGSYFQLLICFDVGNVREISYEVIY